MSGGWGVVRVKAKQECLASQHLKRQSFRVYCPLIHRRARRASKWVDVCSPMFPGYVFVHIDLAHLRWRPIQSTIGVKQLMCVAGRPSLLDENFIDDLRSRERDGVVSHPGRPLEIGQSVRITSGPFDGLLATIVDMEQKDRLSVLMDLLNGRITASVPVHKVRPL